MGNWQSVNLDLHCGDERQSFCVKKAAVEEQTFNWATICNLARAHFGVEEEDIYGFAYRYDTTHYCRDPDRILKGQPLDAFLKYLASVASVNERGQGERCRILLKAARRCTQPFLAPSPTAAPGKHQVVNIKIGVPPLFQLLSFHTAAPPTFFDVLRAGQRVLNLPDDAAPSELLLVEENGDLVRLANEVEWQQVGWPRARQVFLAGQEQGGWRAATFQLSGMNLPSYNPHHAMGPPGYGAPGTGQ
ncbi:hypothetical protein JCM10213_008909 [Rhodosporidiobolus nylandii]